jgi:hypothetical protein
MTNPFGQGAREEARPGPFFKRVGDFVLAGPEPAALG